MTSLLDQLTRQDGSRPALVTPAGTLTVADLIARARRWQDCLWAAAIPAIAKSENIVDFLEVLIGSDGWVEILCLQPSSTDPPPGFLDRPVRPLPKEQQTKFILSTSGTTGEPKFILHTLESLTATTNRHSSYRWGLLYDPARFAGLQVVLQALLSGGTLAVPRREKENLNQSVDFMIESGVTALSATPSQWRRLLMVSSLSSLPLQQITLGGEIADDRILQSLRSLFPAARITHIYASTETGVGFSVQDGQAGFPLSYLDEGGLTGVCLKISADNHLLLRRESWPDFIDTEDLVEIRGARVYFLGRASGLINVGGNKVCPETVEEILLDHPGVVAARVFGAPSSILGSIVVAEVQIKDSSQSERITTQLNELCRVGLSAYQRPARIRIVDELNINSGGKIARNQDNHE